MPLPSTLDPALAGLLAALPERVRASASVNEPLARHTTLRVGGPADLFVPVTAADDLAETVRQAQERSIPWFLLGGGSNVLVGDRGVRGLVVHNRASHAEIGTIATVDCGHSLMGLFIRTAGFSLSGLEFAVGIPGTVGGALVSNAGAYRALIGPLVQRVDVVECGVRRWVDAEWMRFAYRDSRIRHSDLPPACLVRVELALEPARRRDILAAARENQHRRIHRQSWYPSAGSFFKNVESAEFAARVEGLPEPLRRSGVVPAGFLSEACGCRGLRVGGAQISVRHGNFVLNRGGATASDIRRLADAVKSRVRDRFAVELQEEVLTVGEWGGHADG